MTSPDAGLPGEQRNDEQGQARDAIVEWADHVAFIRDTGEQVAYAASEIPLVKQLHDDMLRSLLTWRRAEERAAQRKEDR